MQLVQREKRREEERRGEKRREEGRGARTGAAEVAGPHGLHGGNLTGKLAGQVVAYAQGHTQIRKDMSGAHRQHRTPGGIEECRRGRSPGR